MSVSIPAIEATDGSDTRWALETARTLWTQGERRDALQWIRRAAEAAAEAGQDDRALGLAKMGAELRNALDIPRTLPPPPVEAPPVVIPPPAAAPSLAAPDPAPAPVRSAAAPVTVPPPSERGDTELVVTVVATDGSIPAPDAALVAHRAIRVAVLPGGNGTELRVTVLGPGQVAPRDAVVSLLVALAPGASPVPAPAAQPRAQ